ncbi:MAG TPA: hypothetical protein IAC35_01260 [Candidatus Cryptobacteroides merdipullorum]|uniref:Fimbrillin family protein n=1 Tax=Candidatus Cryptobacteroides merdipullorum TaxID=2840771 RepID=A0A9D1GN99_9BACT|nr:hypothetical protein [Candidatus Cryptobacteroides merdipullorum]
MKNNRLFTTICLMAATLFTACTQDELAEQGNTLPDGEYPLQIGSVSITAEASEEPWTRVTENEDGTVGEWEWDGMEKFAVRLGDETAVYTLNPDHTMTADRQLYWKSTAPATVTAWYPATDGALYLGGQDNGLVYVLRATADNASHNTPVNLQFEHQLAKVRVVTKGTAEVRDISIWNVPMTCFIEEGKITGLDNSFIGDIQMLPVEREGIGTCWEASVGPGVEIKSFIIENTETVSQICDLTSPVTTQAGALHTITITANSEGMQTIDLSNEDCIINDDGTYYFSGTGNHAIRVMGGKPNIYLEDAQINVSDGNAIDITGGNPTIHVMGENTIANNSFDTDGAGIYVAQGSTVTITGRDRNDVLTAQGGNNGAGIGGYGRQSEGHTSCGDITISNVTVHAYSAGRSFDYPGIGSRVACGTIAIDNATVYARGTGTSDGGYPAIGANSTVPVITISGSEIHAFRGSSHADWIGQYGNVYGYQGGAIQGTITGTTVYKGLWDKNSGQATDEGIVEYGVDDVGTEQSQ